MFVPAIFDSSFSYSIANSLRLRASNSAYLSRNMVVGDGHKWTCHFKIKRGTIGVAQTIINTSASPGSNNLLAQIYFDSTDRLGFFQLNGGTTYTNILTNRVFRDPSAHYAITIIYDDAQATAADRVKIFVSEVQETSFSLTSYPSQNFNGFFSTSTNPVNIGRYIGSGPMYADCLLSEFYWVSGQALIPSNFGETDSNGVWAPKRYSGDCGTDGYYLPFDDGTNLTTLGADRSGNGNNWTLNNISLTAGVTYDWFTDTPTNNFCTLSPLWIDGVNPASLSQGNLACTTSVSGGFGCNATFGVNSGKWYWEMTSASSNNVAMLGIRNQKAVVSYAGADTNGYSYYQIGQKYFNNAATAYGATWTTGDIIGVAFDATAGTLEFFKNGVSQGVAFTSIPTDYWVPAHSDASGASATSDYYNFGQRPFAYTPPSGFKSLCTANLPAVAIPNPSLHSVVKLDTGANIKSTAEAVFPSNFLEVIKDRANANNWQWLDSVRGNTAVLQSNTTSAETTYTAPSGSSSALVLKAGGTAVTNNAGSISSQVSANTAAGFSVVTCTLTGANATIGHGLGVAPKLVIGFRRTGGTASHPVYHSGLSSAANVIYLDSTSAQSSASTIWNSAAPTSTVFSVGTGLAAADWVFYCFAEVLGYSKISSYTGNGSTDGSFIYCGFKPRWVLIKRSDSTGDWCLFDTTRETENVVDLGLYPNLSNAESSFTAALDLNSNGFKLRTSSSLLNASGGTYIYIAIAESPFGGSNVSPSTAR